MNFLQDVVGYCIYSNFRGVKLLRILSFSDFQFLYSWTTIFAIAQEPDLNFHGCTLLQMDFNQ